MAEFPALLTELEPPLGVKGSENLRESLQRIIMQVDIPIRRQRLSFLETLHALAGYTAGALLLLTFLELQKPLPGLITHIKVVQTPWACVNINVII